MESDRSSYVRKIRRKGRTKWALCYVSADGRRHQEMTEASTREAAKLLLRKRLDEIVRQKALGLSMVSDITFEEFAKKYLLHQKSALEPSSYERVRASVENFLVPAFGKRKLNEIRPRDIQEFVNERAQTVYHLKKGGTKKIAPATVHRDLQTVQGIFTLAVEWDYVLANPAKKVRFRKYEWRKQRILTLPEQARLFEAFQLNERRHYLADVVTVALYTGMREDEILRLTWSDVDLSGGVITVRSTNENPTKGKRTRPIKMAAQVQGTLARLYMQALAETKGTAASILGRYVFTNPRTGTRYVDTKLGWKASLRDAGIDGLRFHDLRHTFATRAILGGADVVKLQQVLGHQDVTTTMRYVHLSGQDAGAVMDCVEGFESKQKPSSAAEAAQ